MTGASVNQIDLLGSQGGGLAMAFASGCVACWGFMKAFVSGPVNKSYEKRISSLEREKHECHQRVNQLEAFLFFHGGGELRSAMQSALSEERIERLQRDAELQRDIVAPTKIYREDI